jgi:hypothetical protein
MTPRDSRRPRRTRTTNPATTTRTAAAEAADRRFGPAATYRQLVTRGFASSEAANLTAYLNDLPIADQPWTLRQVNAVLFLQKLREAGRFGASDGAPAGTAA